MMAPLHLLQARVELQARADDMAARSYLTTSGVSMAGLLANIGFFTVTPIADCGAGRFEFAGAAESDGTPGFVLEAFGEDNETAMDLVAWPCSSPAAVRSLLGRASLLGLSQALNPASYFCGLPLDMHRTGLEWLQAGCSGSVVVTPHLAAPILLQAPGRIAGRDTMHGYQLARLAASAIPKLDPNKFLVPIERKAA